MTKPTKQSSVSNGKKMTTHLKDYQFKKGGPPGPGRPKGQSLKEYWRERFKNMTDDEKIEFTRKVGPEMIWRMAEGNPEQGTDITSGGKELAPILVKFLDGKDDRDTRGV